MVGFTSRQIERTKLASEIYNNVVLPTVNNFKRMLSTNMVSNCPMAVAHISNADNIYGPLVSILKDNSTRIKPKPVIKDYIHIPSEIIKNNSNIELCIDVV